MLTRPILVATIGYILGIIMGLYFFQSIVPFFVINKTKVYILTLIGIAFILVVTIVLSKISLKTVKRYFRYIKLIINFRVIILIITTSIIGFLSIYFHNNSYEKVYNKFNEINEQGKVISNRIEKDYNDVYKVKIGKRKFLCYVSKSILLEYGDIIDIKGKYEKPNTKRNTKSFDYSNYLKTKSIYGIIKAQKIVIKNRGNSILKTINNIQKTIKDNSNKILDNDIKSIYLGLILGDTSYMNNEIEEQFKEANMAHILAVSGMHVSYLIIRMFIFF